jgi:hypothetical protein
VLLTFNIFLGIKLLSIDNFVQPIDDRSRQMVALQPDEDHFVSHWNDDDDDHDHVSVFPSSAPEILIETTPTTTKKRRSGILLFIYLN